MALHPAGTDTPHMNFTGEVRGVEGGREKGRWKWGGRQRKRKRWGEESEPQENVRRTLEREEDELPVRNYKALKPTPTKKSVSIPT